jgi:hypothetical protein
VTLKILTWILIAGCKIEGLVLAPWFISPELSGKRGLSCYFTLISSLSGRSMMGKILAWLQERVKHWTKPATSVLIIGALSDLTRSRAALVGENALLCQKLIMLPRCLGIFIFPEGFSSVSEEAI